MAQEDEITALRDALLASVEKNENSHGGEDEEDLTALRFAALISKKSKNNGTQQSKPQAISTTVPAVPTAVLMPTHQLLPSVSTIPGHPLPSTNTPMVLQQVSQAPFATQFPTTQLGFEGQFPGSRPSGRTNLIHIQTQPPPAQKKPASSTKPLIVLPQDKWSGVAQQQVAPASPEPKVSSKFSRYKSRDSDSDEDEDSDNESEDDNSDTKSVIIYHNSDVEGDNDDDELANKSEDDVDNKKLVNSDSESYKSVQSDLSDAESNKCDSDIESDNGKSSSSSIARSDSSHASSKSSSRSSSVSCHSGNESPSPAKSPLISPRKSYSPSPPPVSRPRKPQSNQRQAKSKSPDRHDKNGCRPRSRSASPHNHIRSQRKRTVSPGRRRPSPTKRRSNSPARTRSPEKYYSRSVGSRSPNPYDQPGYSVYRNYKDPKDRDSRLHNYSNDHYRNRERMEREDYWDKPPTRDYQTGSRRDQLSRDRYADERREALGRGPYRDDRRDPQPGKDYPDHPRDHQHDRSNRDRRNSPRNEYSDDVRSLQGYRSDHNEAARYPNERHDPHSYQSNRRDPRARDYSDEIRNPRRLDDPIRDKYADDRLQDYRSQDRQEPDNRRTYEESRSGHRYADIKATDVNNKRLSSGRQESDRHDRRQDDVAEAEPRDRLQDSRIHRQADSRRDQPVLQQDKENRYSRNSEWLRDDRSKSRDQRNHNVPEKNVSKSPQRKTEQKKLSPEEQAKLEARQKKFASNSEVGRSECKKISLKNIVKNNDADLYSESQSDELNSGNEEQLTGDSQSNISDISDSEFSNSDSQDSVMDDTDSDCDSGVTREKGVSERNRDDIEIERRRMRVVQREKQHDERKKQREKIRQLEWKQQELKRENREHERKLKEKSSRSEHENHPGSQKDNHGQRKKQSPVQSSHRPINTGRSPRSLSPVVKPLMSMVTVSRKKSRELETFDQKSSKSLISVAKHQDKRLNLEVKVKTESKGKRRTVVEDKHDHEDARQIILRMKQRKVAKGDGDKLSGSPEPKKTKKSHAEEGHRSPTISITFNKDREYKKESKSRTAIHKRLGQSVLDQDGDTLKTKHRKHKERSIVKEDGHLRRVIHEERPTSELVSISKPKKIDLRNIIRPKADDELVTKVPVKRKSGGSEPDVPFVERKKIRLKRPGRVCVQSVVTKQSDYDEPVKEADLDERIRKIHKQNEKIMIRSKIVEKEKQHFH